MRLKKNRIARLAQALTDRLTEQKAIRLEGPKADLTALLDRIITDELMVEDRLDAEVREILRTLEADIERGQVDERKMFLMVKKQLAKEREIIL